MSRGPKVCLYLFQKCIIAVYALLHYRLITSAFSKQDSKVASYINSRTCATTACLKASFPAFCGYTKFTRFLPWMVLWLYAYTVSKNKSRCYLPCTCLQLSRQEWTMHARARHPSKKTSKFYCIRWNHSLHNHRMLGKLDLL